MFCFLQAPPVACHRERRWSADIAIAILSEAENKSKSTNSSKEKVCLPTLSEDSHETNVCFASNTNGNSSFSKNSSDQDVLLLFNVWASEGEGGGIVDVVDMSVVVNEKNDSLADLVGADALDELDSMSAFTEHLSDELDKISEKVLGNDSCLFLDDQSPNTKQRACVAAWALLGD